MARYKLTIEYDGTGLLGWQRQKDGLTIQQHIEEAIHAFCGETVIVTASGRTDAGVHARGQVAHVDLVTNRETYSILQGVNYHLIKANANIALLSVEHVDDSFEARFHAKKREYLYLITNRPARLALDHNRAWHVHEKLDIDAMKRAAEYLIGHHDFTSFRATGCQAKSPMKTLERIEINTRRDKIMIRIHAQSFLHHMVRNITGTLVDVAKGKTQPDDIKTMLEAKDRRASGPTAPAHGLYFMCVHY